MEQRTDPNGDTFDYGLAPGETYEPETIDEIDRSGPHIMTVLGPVEPGALGVTNMAASFATLPDDPAAILTEIEEAGFVGLNAFVNLAPLGTPSEAETARWLAGRCDLHLIVTTGPAGESPLDSLSSAIDSGIAGSGVYPGAIVTALDPATLAAADRARTESGLPLIVRAESPVAGSTLRSALRESGVELNGLIVTGAITDPGALLADGATLLIAIDRREDARAAAAMAAELVKQQLSGQVMVGFDPQPENDSVSYVEGSRWSWLIEQFPLLLLDAGLDAMTVRAVMIENPNRALTIHPPATTGSVEESS